MHDAPRDCEPEPRTFALRLRREEGFEHALDDFRRNAAASVAHAEQHVAPRPGPWVRAAVLTVDDDLLRLDADAPAVRHGVARVQRKVHQHLLELARVDQEPW